MENPTTERQFIRKLARQHGVSESAVVALIAAVTAGNGTAAQFNHPDLGGIGQWLAGGMTMIGDFSNHRLKATVAELCSAIAAHLREQPATASHSAAAAWPTEMFPSAGAWWPTEFGQPTASGAQNDMHYAYFAQQRRLVIRLGRHVRIYDTQGHHIHSVAQQQDRQQTLVFRSQAGELAITQLPKLHEYQM